MEKETNPKYRTLILDYVKYRTLLTKKFEKRKPYVPDDPSKLKAFISGTIRKVFVKKGTKVERNDKLLILEAMKMKNIIYAPFDAKIKKVYVKEGEMVPKSALLIEFE